MSDTRLTLGAKIVWLLLAPAVIGALTGTCVALMIGGVERFGNQYLESLPGIVPGLFGPVALLLTYLVSRFVTRVETPSTSELYVTIYHEPKSRVPLEQVPGRVLATATTVGFGGSQGFESTSALVGASWSEAANRVAFLAPPPAARKSLLAAGASAGIAAVFSSPGAGALYGMEVPFKNDVDAPRLVPCVVSAAASFVMRVSLLGEHRIVLVNGAPTVDPSFLLGCLLVAIGCGVGTRLFAFLMDWLRHFGDRHSRIVRAIVGGCLLTLAAIAGYELCGRWITFGSGYIAADWLLADERSVGIVLVALLIRAGGNLITVYGGGGGGVFTSLACNGAFVGEAVARLVGDPSHTLALIGAACFLGAGYRIPLACMLFVAEAGIGVVPTVAGLVAVAIAFGLMGEESVSDAQIECRP